MTKRDSLVGNSPFSVPVTIDSKGNVALWDLPCREGCPLPTLEGAIRQIGDPRMMMIIAMQALRRKNVLYTAPGGSGSHPVKMEDVEYMQLSVVRWSFQAGIEQHYEMKGVRLVGLDRLPKTATEYLSRAQLPLPSRSEPNPFPQGFFSNAGEVVLAGAEEDGQGFAGFVGPKRLIEDDDETMNVKEKRTTPPSGDKSGEKQRDKLNPTLFAMPPAGETAGWYLVLVLGFKPKSKLVLGGDGEPIGIICPVQIIEWDGKSMDCWGIGGIAARMPDTVAEDIALWRRHQAGVNPDDI